MQAVGKERREKGTATPAASQVRDVASAATISQKKSPVEREMKRMKRKWKQKFFSFDRRCSERDE